MTHRNRMLRWPLVLGTLLLVVLVTVAADGGDFDVRYLFATLGVAAFGAIGRYIWIRDQRLMNFEVDVSTALWGPRDANGRRDVAQGVVATWQKVAHELPQMLEAAQGAAEAAKEAAKSAESAAVLATTAASAARTTQRLLVECQKSHNCMVHGDHLPQTD